MCTPNMCIYAAPDKIRPDKISESVIDISNFFVYDFGLFHFYIKLYKTFEFEHQLSYRVSTKPSQQNSRISPGFPGVF